MVQNHGAEEPRRQRIQSTKPLPALRGVVNCPGPHGHQQALQNLIPSTPWHEPHRAVPAPDVDPRHPPWSPPCRPGKGWASTAPAPVLTTVTVT